MKNVLVVGSGGREHALAWKLAQAKNIGKIFVAPGNAGTSELATNIAIDPENISGLLDFTRQNNIYLTVVGPDGPLAVGIVDAFLAAGQKIFGPTKQAAEIEWSKSYAKQLMKKYGIPTASYEVFSQLSDANRYISQAAFPLVIKADGLALGKGVFICQTPGEADRALQTVFEDKQFGTAGNSVVIEEFLEGKEVSAHAICDGENFLLFPLAQDHKRIGEGNTGPMTGGMGTICPIEEPMAAINEIVANTLAALKNEGREFTGCLFPGIMLTKNGPKVLEFNARFGDPETQVYLPLIENDLLELLSAATEKRLGGLKLSCREGAAACVVLASAGYPAQYPVGLPIKISNKYMSDNVVVFHAGTKTSGDKLVTSGGRVLGVTATGENLTSALKSAYTAAKTVSFKGKYFRKDIGHQYATISS